MKIDLQNIFDRQTAFKEGSYDSEKESTSCLLFFGNFWLTIQNTASRQVRNLFYLVAVFISFPLARAAAAALAVRNRSPWP